ncbi:hypothetical protein AAGT95_04845 [Salinicola lusitanus]|uniref:Uncharacterized protein n=1 Tax=Salinicola lusitanus TaxID=1949085 RepID=A0ABZ3CVS1_9GAMM
MAPRPMSPGWPRCGRLPQRGARYLRARASPIFQRFAGTLASCCFSAALDLREDGPSAFVMEPPGYQLHLWRANEVITHHRVIGDHAGPYPLHEAGGLIDD